MKLTHSPSRASFLIKMPELSFVISRVIFSWTSWLVGEINLCLLIGRLFVSIKKGLDAETEKSLEESLGIRKTKKSTPYTTDRRTAMVKPICLHNFVDEGIQTYFQCGEIVEKCHLEVKISGGGVTFSRPFVQNLMIKFDPIQLFTFKNDPGVILTLKFDPGFIFQWVTIKCYEGHSEKCDVNPQPNTRGIWPLVCRTSRYRRDVMHVLAVISSITCHFFFICQNIFIRVIWSGRKICPLLMDPSIFLAF